jgi:hypothetical protein
MAKTELGEVHHWYSDDNDVLGRATTIASIDEGEPYETDQTDILVETEGTFLLATASGCSCWDGDWYVTRYDTVEELLEDIGPQGSADNGGYNPSFKGVEDLLKQVEEWKNSQ